LASGHARSDLLGSATRQRKSWLERRHLHHRKWRAAIDYLTPEKEVLDTDRVMFLKSYLKCLHRLVAEGYPMCGYFLWSFMDNFEWSWGYEKRFGIVFTNYETQERIPKASALWYAEVMKQNRVV
jgi:beta-glucosidase